MVGREGIPGYIGLPASLFVRVPASLPVPMLPNVTAVPVCVHGPAVTYCTFEQRVNEPWDLSGICPELTIIDDLSHY